MLKHLALTFLMICSVTTTAKTFIAEPYVNIVEGLNGKKSEIFEFSKIWFSKNFFSSHEAIRYSNADEGKIIGQAIVSPICDKSVRKLECLAYSSARISFNITIDIKDNKARFTFDNLGYALHNNVPLNDPNIYRLTLNSFDGIIENYKSNEKNYKTNDNW